MSLEKHIKKKTTKSYVKIGNVAMEVDEELVKHLKKKSGEPTTEDLVAYWDYLENGDVTAINSITFKDWFEMKQRTEQIESTKK